MLIKSRSVNSPLWQTASGIPNSGAHGSLASAGHLPDGDMAAAGRPCLQSGGCSVEGLPKHDGSAVPQPSEAAEACADTVCSGAAQVLVSTNITTVQRMLYCTASTVCVSTAFVLYFISNGSSVLVRLLSWLKVPLEIKNLNEFRSWISAAWSARMCSGHLLPSPLHMAPLRGQSSVQELGLLSCRI